MTEARYATPAAFKQALEQRLRSASRDGADLARRRQLLVFDRFLARVTRVFGDAVMLKGGLVLELRLAAARTTKDIDLRIQGSLGGALEELRAAGRLDLGDFMRFEVRTDPGHPTILSDGMRYEGYRFRAECRLAAKLYGSPFGVDVATGDPLVGEPEIVLAADVLAFAGVEPPRLTIYPLESHIAEKLHAYTIPRTRPNTRVKDLPDIALLATAGAIDGATLREALDRTFTYRATHPQPRAVPAPPEFWQEPYAAMAQTDSLVWKTLADVHGAAAAFLDPVLRGELSGTWDRTTRCWRLDDSRGRRA